MKNRTYLFVAALALKTFPAHALNLALPCQAQLDRLFSLYEIDTSNPTKSGSITKFERNVPANERKAFDAALTEATTKGVPMSRAGAPLYLGTRASSGMSDLWNRSAVVTEKGDLVTLQISGYSKDETYVPNPKTRINENGIKLKKYSNYRTIVLRKEGKSCYLDGFQYFDDYIGAEGCRKILKQEELVCAGKAKEGTLTDIAREVVRSMPGNKRVYDETSLRDAVDNCRKINCKSSPKILASMLEPEGSASTNPAKPSTTVKGK
jgi:osmotically-inducible protein OsmY